MSDITYGKVDSMSGMAGTSVLVDTNDLFTVTGSSITGAYNTTSSTIKLKPTANDLLDKRELNLLVVEHKVSEVEMIKLKEVQPDFADVIKDNISKKAAKEVTKKMTFTKKKLPDEDTHHFLGRVYVFTREELVQLIEEAQNAR